MQAQPEVPSGRKTTLPFTLEPWGDMWYSKHHYAAELSKCRIEYFISPPDKWCPTDLCYMNDADALLAQLAAFLRQGEAPELTAKRISFARTRTYDHNIAAIANFLLAPK